MSVATVKQDDNTGRWVLFATISASSMAFIGGSALNVALPALQADLGASGSELLWIINAFALLLAALLLVGGSLGDHYGRKRIYMIGIVIFAIASLACGFAPTTEFLIVSRAVQGIGGALMIPGSLAIISAYFSDKERGEAIGTWSAFTTLTSVLGPVIGGILAENGLWRGVFFINIPLAIVAIWSLITYVPESYDEEAPKELDFLGSFFVTVGLAGITYGFLQGPEQGFDQPLIIGSIIVGVLGLIAFIWQEYRSDHPMMPLSLYKSRTFSGSNLLTLLLYGALGGALFFLPLNLIQVQGYGETVAGLTLLPFSILLVVLSRRMGSFVDQYGPRIPLTVGPAIVGVAFILLGLNGMTDGPDAYWTTFFPPLVVFGVGMGITVAPLVTAVMGSVPQHNAGIASGINNAMSRSSQVLAYAIMGGIALVFFSQSLTVSVQAIDLSESAETQLIEEEAKNLAGAQIPDSVDESQVEAVDMAIKTSFVETFQLMMFIGAGLSFLSAILGWIFVESELKPPEEEEKPKPAEATA